MKGGVKGNAAGARSGFTLIEIMVAMAVFAIVVAAIYSTWTTVLKASRTSQEVAAQAQRERITVRILEEALASTHAFAADLKHYSFVIDNSANPEFSFSARLPGAFPRSGRYGDFAMRRVIFTVEKGSLMMRQYPILMEMDEDEKEHPLELAHNVKKFLVEAMDGQSGLWSDAWEQTNQIPKMVRITLTFDPPHNASAFAVQVQDNIQRVIALPSVAVQATWQKPSLQRNQGGGGGGGGGGGTGGQPPVIQ